KFFLVCNEERITYEKSAKHYHSHHPDCRSATACRVRAQPDIAGGDSIGGAGGALAGKFACCGAQGSHDETAGEHDRAPDGLLVGGVIIVCAARNKGLSRAEGH